MDLTPDPEIIKPFGKGETLTPRRAEAVLVAAAQELMLSGPCDAVPGWFASPVGRWLTRLSGEVGAAGSGIDDEMAGGLVLANIVLRSRGEGGE